MSGLAKFLPHTVGIHEWPAFFKKFGPASSATSEFVCFYLTVLALWLLACYSIVWEVNFLTFLFHLEDL